MEAGSLTSLGPPVPGACPLILSLDGSLSRSLCSSCFGLILSPHLSSHSKGEPYLPPPGARLQGLNSLITPVSKELYSWRYQILQTCGGAHHCLHLRKKKINCAESMRITWDPRPALGFILSIPFVPDSLLNLFFLTSTLGVFLLVSLSNPIYKLIYTTQTWTFRS